DMLPTWTSPEDFARLRNSVDGDLLMTIQDLVLLCRSSDSYRAFVLWESSGSALVVFQASVISRAVSRWREDGCSETTRLLQVHWTVVLTRDLPEMICTLSVPGVDIAILSLAAWPLE
ncbi:hypothetical protein HGM15179_020787, partial [Zosterops borbonicus]